MTRKISLPIMAALPPKMLKEVLEHDLSVAIVRYGEERGWRAYYQRKSAMRGADGVWRGLSDKGWPDLVLVRAGRMVCAELKSEVGRVTPEQTEWLKILAAVPGVTTALWRPRDSDLIMEVLK